MSVSLELVDVNFSVPCWVFTPPDASNCFAICLMLVGSFQNCTHTDACTQRLRDTNLLHMYTSRFTHLWIRNNMCSSHQLTRTTSHLHWHMNDTNAEHIKNVTLTSVLSSACHWHDGVVKTQKYNKNICFRPLPTAISTISLLGKKSHYHEPLSAVFLWCILVV